MMPKSKVKVNVLNLNDKIQILYFWKGNQSLVEVGWCYGKNESSSHSI
jgi:hypothetical protein